MILEVKITYQEYLDNILDRIKMKEKDIEELNEKIKEQKENKKITEEVKVKRIFKLEEKIKICERHIIREYKGLKKNMNYERPEEDKNEKK